MSDDQPTEPTEDGCCPVCGSESVRQTSAGIGDAPLSDITWPECDDCEWRGCP